MKRAIKILFISLLAILIIGGLGGYLYLTQALPDVGPAPDLQVEITPERIERGDYLANHVAMCMDCHSQRDWTKFSGPLMEGTFGAGGERFGPELGLPGVMYSKNITPAGIGDWTDGELFRAITCGVTKNGKAIFPIMPYMAYGQMTEEDIYSIIAYVRSLEPIEAEWPESELDFPMNLVLNTIPIKGQLSEPVDPNNKLAYGKYLSAACLECHTPFVKGQLVMEEAFSGGREFVMPSGGVIRSANITPYKTGLGIYTEEEFIRKFKSYDPSVYDPPHVGENDFNSIMPWVMTAGITEEDLSAIYTYLSSLEPVEKDVVKYTPPQK